MKNAELELLKEKCIFYTQFLMQRLSAFPELIKGLEETYRWVEQTYEDEKIKPLQEMSAEIDDLVIRHMPLSMAIEFKNLIREKLRVNYDLVEKAHNKIITQIMRKKKISSKEEYKLIATRIDEIFADLSKSKELKKMSQLLAAFDSENEDQKSDSAET